MTKPVHEMRSWDATSQASLTSTVPPDEWQATRAQTALATQLLRRDEDDDGLHEIGRRIDDRQHELFVSCDPGEAMQQQCERLKPEYIALHDVGANASRRLVAGIAAALGRPVQKLVIRRHGLGVGLATLEFVELPTVEGVPLRLYTTQVDADTQARHDLARVLLAFSRLGVMIVADLPQHALQNALKPLAEAIAAGPWPNQQLLLLPLASASVLAAQAATLGTARGVNVRTTPQVTKPNEAWNYLSGAWNRLREQLAAAGSAGLPAIGALAPTPAATAAPGSLPMRPMPNVPAAGAAALAASGDDPLLSRYAGRLLEIKGMVSACVFELATQRPLAHAGAKPPPAMLAAQGSALVSAMLGTSRALGYGGSPPDAAITLGDHHLLLRPLPGRPGLMLHAVLDKAGGNLVLARLQMLRLDSVLAEEG